MKKYILSASITFCMMGISACDEWSNHYIEGVHLYQNRQYEKADIELSKAINLTKNDRSESHIFIRINRAKNFLQLDECYKALEDINEVIDCPSLSKKDLIDALEVRMRAYAGLEMHSRFQEDYTWYKSMNPNMPKLEYTEKYIVIRHCEIMHPSDQEVLYGLFVAAELCENTSKITRLSDLVIIERKNKEACRCLGGICSEDEIERKRQLESCYWHCNLVAQMACEMAGKLIQINPAFFPTLIMIEILNDVCKDCCGDNGGFYINCIAPIRQYYEVIKLKVKQLFDHVLVNNNFVPRDENG